MSNPIDSEEEKKRQQILKEAERKMKLKMIEEKMKSLIKSSVDMDITLEPGTTWGFNPRKKVITYCQHGEQNIFNLTENEVMSFILHEIAHANFTETFKPTTPIPEPRLDYGTFLNTCDDIRVEKKLMDKYPGTYDSFRRSAQNVQDQLEEDFIQMVPAHINYLLNLRQHQWKFKLYFKNKQVEDMFLDTLLLIKQAANLPTITEMHTYLVSDVWPKFKQLIEDQEKEDDNIQSSHSHQLGHPDPNLNSQPSQNQNNGQQDQKEEEEKKDSPNQQENEQQNSAIQQEENQEQEKENNSNGGNEQTLKEQSQKGNSKQTPEEQKRDQEYKQHVKEQLKTAFSKTVMEMKELVDTVKQFSRHADENRGKTLEEEVNEELERQKKKNQTEQKQAKSEINVGGKNTRDFKTYEELYADIAIYIPYFKLKLQSIIKDNKMRRYGGAFTRGKLNNKLLYKWKCKSTRLFSQKIRRMHKDYAVTLLIDESGSMTFGDKHLNAARGAVLLSEVLNAINIPFEIRGFNASERIYKKFSQPFSWTVKRNLENIIPSATNGDNSNTNDAFAVNWASDALAKESGEKILIVLCDGEPNPEGYRIPEKDRIRLKGLFQYYTDFNLDIEVMKAKRHALVVGVGIQSTSVTRHYTDNVVCNDIGELPTLIMNIIKKHIRRG